MSDLKQYLIDEFVEDYQEGRLTRREALKRLVGLTGRLVVANSILAACTPAAEPTATAAPPTSVPRTALPPTAALATATTAAPTDTPPTAAAPTQSAARDAWAKTLAWFEKYLKA